MSAKPKPMAVDPYAQMEGPVVSQQLIDDLSSGAPSLEARDWLARAMDEIETDPEGFRPAQAVMDEMHRLIDRIEADRGD